MTTGSPFPRIEVERDARLPNRILSIRIDGHEIRGVREVQTSQTVDDVPTTIIILIGTPEYVVKGDA